MANCTKMFEYLREHGIAPGTVAAAVGISRGMFSDWKAGRSHPKDATIDKIVEYLGCKRYEIVDGAFSDTKVPVYGKIAAGIPIEAIEDILDYEEIPEAMAHNGEYIALQAQGDSMEPTIPNGANVIIRKQSDCDTGKICAVFIDGEYATLKKVVKRTNGITLMPLNPKYEPINFTNEEVASLPVTILGVAVEVRSKL